jgi:hypothetical protein
MPRPSAEQQTADDIREALLRGTDEGGLPVGWTYASADAVPTPDRAVEAPTPVDDVPLGTDLPGPRLSRNGVSYFCRGCETVLARRSATSVPKTFCAACEVTWNQRRVRAANRTARQQISLPTALLDRLQELAEQIEYAVGGAVMEFRRRRIPNGGPIDDLMLASKDLAALLIEVRDAREAGARQVGAGA